MSVDRRTAELVEHAMDAWGALVYRLAQSQTRSPHDADDVAQDVFMRLIGVSVAFRDDEHLKAWLIRCTVNRCRELRRSAWKRRVSATDIAAPELANLEAPVQELVKSDVWEAVSRLPKQLRLIVHLRYYEGYSVDEIASLARCKPATVRTRLFRARKRLKLDLEQEVEHETDELGRLPLADGQR